MNHENLEIIRKNIDFIDCRIMEHINHRMELAVKLRKFKQYTIDNVRELQILTNIKKLSRNLIRPEFSYNLYRLIIDESIAVQEKNLKLIGFQGEHGAYDEVASVLYDPFVIPIPCKNFLDLFSKVSKGQLDFGIIPIGNSIEGLESRIYNLLAENDLQIVGETVVPVHHNLLALPNIKSRNLKFVYSHPKILSQCSKFISRHSLEAKSIETISSAELFTDASFEFASIIANKLYADINHLEIIKENIEDYPLNSIRFIILSRKVNSINGDKCSILFSVKGETGSVFSVLKIFNDLDINIVNIVSVSLKNNFGNYAFFTDFEGSYNDCKVINALKMLQTVTLSLKFLGCYKSCEEVIK